MYKDCKRFKDFKFLKKNIVNSFLNKKTILDFCTKCKSHIEGDVPGVTALGNAYHVTCFTCDDCQKQLAGCSFYNVDGRNLCQVDYMVILFHPITYKILLFIQLTRHYNFVFVEFIGEMR